MGKNSVIMTDTTVDGLIDLRIKNRPKLRGKMGVFKGSKAVRIEQILG
jgi:flagellar motor switch protein FliM